MYRKMVSWITLRSLSPGNFFHAMIETTMYLDLDLDRISKAKEGLEMGIYSISPTTTNFLHIVYFCNSSERGIA